MPIDNDYPTDEQIKAALDGFNSGGKAGLRAALDKARAGGMSQQKSSTEISQEEDGPPSLWGDDHEEPLRMRGSLGALAGSQNVRGAKKSPHLLDLGAEPHPPLR